MCKLQGTHQGNYCGCTVFKKAMSRQLDNSQRNALSRKSATQSSWLREAVHPPAASSTTPPSADSISTSVATTLVALAGTLLFYAAVVTKPPARTSKNKRRRRKPVMARQISQETSTPVTASASHVQPVPAKSTATETELSNPSSSTLASQAPISDSVSPVAPEQVLLAGGSPLGPRLT